MTRTIGVAAIALLAACASAPRSEPRGGPRGLRASEHLDAAREHEEIARHPGGMPTTYVAPDGRGLHGNSGMPWQRRWDTSGEQRRLADVHRSQAAELQDEYEKACGSRTLEQIAMSPLQRYAIGGWPTSTGMILYLDPRAGTADKLLADMQCHRAWMMLAPSSMEDCPLDLPGIVLDARGDRDGITVLIVERDPKLVDELHRRAERDLEASTQLRR
jgi:hypothetical protein